MNARDKVRASDLRPFPVINLGVDFTGEFILWKFIEPYTYYFYTSIRQFT